MASLTRVLLLSTLIAGCGTDKPDLDPSALDSIDVNEVGKDDSFRKPTLKGSIGMNEAATGRVTRLRAFHAYDFTYTGTSGLVRLDVKSTVGDDMFLAVYRRAGATWLLEDYNDDCGDGSLDACLAHPSTAGRYRLVVTTFDAMIGAPHAANYQLAVSCKDGDCLAQACGGFAGFACPTGQYCSYAADAMCGAADQMGTCAPIPEACTAEVAPVCGCDDQTYGNACEAAAAGVSVIHDGACEVACGARAGDTCSADEYCKFELSEVCGRADAQGVCAPRPQVCTAQFDPVCGCDNQTYSNTCAAAAAGVGVLAEGACPAE